MKSWYFLCNFAYAKSPKAIFRKPKVDAALTTRTSMKEQTAQFNVLAEKPVGRLLLQYALPAIVAMAAASVYNIIDGIFIGQGVGPEAIMGLALTCLLYTSPSPRD